MSIVLNNPRLIIEYDVEYDTPARTGISPVQVTLGNLSEENLKKVLDLTTQGDSPDLDNKGDTTSGQ